MLKTIINAAYISDRYFYPILKKTFAGLASTVGKKDAQKSHFFERLPSWKKEEEFLQHITKSVIYEDSNVVCIVKPNGVPMAGSAYANMPLGLEPHNMPNTTISSIVPKLKESFKSDYLKEVYSQPRLFSGPVVFAKNEKAFNNLSHTFKVFKSQKFLYQNFLVLTVGIPTLKEDVSTFAFCRKEREGKLLTENSVKPSIRDRIKREAAILEVEHNILETVTLGSAQSDKIALSSVKANQAKWDMIQAYVVENCLCATLGDHIYSSRIQTIANKLMKLPPKRCLPKTQVLPHLIQEALKITSPTRTMPKIPLHIHCEEITFPNLDFPKKQQKDNMLVIKAPLPEFYMESLSLLGLQYGSS